MILEPDCTVLSYSLDSLPPSMTFVTSNNTKCFYELIECPLIIMSDLQPQGCEYICSVMGLNDRNACHVLF